MSLEKSEEKIFEVKGEPSTSKEKIEKSIGRGYNGEGFHSKGNGRGKKRYFDGHDEQK